MAQPPSDLAWQVPESGAAPLPTPPDNPPKDLIWDQAKPADAPPDGWHVLKSVGIGLANSYKESMGGGAAELGDRILGKKPPPAKEPEKSTGDSLGEFVGGMLNPFTGPSKVGTAFKAARAADKLAGTTLGQQTGSAVIQMLEKTFARMPGGGKIVDSIKAQVDKVAHTTEDIVNHLSGGGDTSATGAGRVINKQLKTAAQQLKDQAGAHFEEVEKLIPPNTPIGVKSTLETLQKLTAEIPGAENSSQGLINPAISGFRKDLEKDVGKAPQIAPGFLPKDMLAGLNKDLENSHIQALPYSAVKQLRTKIGNQIEWGPFSTDPKNGQLKQLYAALTADMNNGAASVSDKAAAAVAHANAAYAASKAQQKILKSVIDKAGGPEKVFNSLMNSGKDGATTISEVVGALDEPSRNILAASALQRMGRATPGAQDAAGSVFSADTFLTNWNRMSPEAREALFGRLPGDYSQSINELVTNIGKLKAYSKIMPNASGTAQAAMWGGEVGGALMAVMTGHWGTAAGIAGTAAGTLSLSAALTNPQTAKWLAQQTGKLAVAAAKGATGMTSDSQSMGASNGQAETLGQPGQADGGTPPGGAQ